jgi:hypothetical protein
LDKFVLVRLHLLCSLVWPKTLLLQAQDGMVVASGGPAAQRGTLALPRKAAQLVQLKLWTTTPSSSLSLQTSSKSQLPLFCFCCMATTHFLPAIHAPLFPNQFHI